MLTDLQLWESAASGEEAAFSELFERHAQKIYNYCFRCTADWATAEDLTSATFLEAWRRRSDVVPEQDSLRPWLLGVATHLIRNAQRGDRRYRQALSRVGLEDSVQHDHADEAISRADDEKQMSAVLEEIGRLPVEEQEVISLCILGECSYEVAAASLSIPVGTVRSRLNRARDRLRASQVSAWLDPIQEEVP